MTGQPTTARIFRGYVGEYQPLESPGDSGPGRPTSLARSMIGGVPRGALLQAGVPERFRARSCQCLVCPWTPPSRVFKAKFAHPSYDIDVYLGGASRLWSRVDMSNGVNSGIPISGANPPRPRSGRCMAPADDYNILRPPALSISEDVNNFPFLAIIAFHAWVFG